MFRKRFSRGTLFAMSTIATIATASAQPANAFATTSIQSPLQLFVTLPVKPHHLDGFLETMRKEVVGARSEAGNLAFNVYEDAGSPSTLYLFEHWANAAALDAHTGQPYYKAIRRQEADDLSGDVAERKLSELLPAQSAGISAPLGSYNLLTLIQVKVDAHIKLAEVFAEVATAIRSAQGNQGFWLYRDLDQPLEFLLIERWTRKSARNESIATKSGRQFQSALTELTSTPVRQTQLIDRSRDQD